MNIVFFYISKEIPTYAIYCMDSIKKFMPTSNVVQVTDMESPKLYGVDEVIRFEPKTEVSFDTVGYVGIEFLSRLYFDEMIYIDPDMMFNGDVEHLLHGEQDITISCRMKNDHMKKWYQKRYPYNSLIAIKTPQFWQDCYKRLNGFKKISWFSNMNVIRKAVDSGKYVVKIVNGDSYNKVPQREDDFTENAVVFHFKGFDRKEYMKPFYERFIDNNPS